MNRLDSSRPAALHSGEVERPHQTRPSPYRPQAFVAIAMIVVADYRLRIRPVTETIGGRADASVWVEILAFATVGLWLLSRQIRPPIPLRPTAIRLSGAAWVGLSAVSVAWAPVPSVAAVRASELVVVAALSFVWMRTADRDLMHQVAHLFLALITVSVIAGFWWRTPVSKRQIDRFSWFAVHPVTAGALLAIACVIGAFYLLQRERSNVIRWPPGAYGVATFICMLGLVLSKTRGSIGAAIIGVAVVWTWSVSRRNRLAAAAMGGAVTAVFAMYWVQPLTTYLLRGESTLTLASFNNRMPLWELAGRRLIERPALGWGLGSTRVLFLEAWGGGGAHNAFINVAVETGLVGLALWLSFVGAIGVGVWRLRRVRFGDAPLLGGLFTTLVVNAVTTEGIGSGYGGLTVWLFIVAAWVGVGQRWSTQQGISRVRAGSARPPARWRTP